MKGNRVHLRPPTTLIEVWRSNIRYKLIEVTAVKDKLFLVLSGAFVMLFCTQSVSPQATPRVTIETATGDALVMTSASNHAWRVGPNSGAGSGFGIYDETAAATRLKIALNGNVGIGTTGPQNALEVAGRIRSMIGGFVFPDGSSQTTAAAGGSYSAGAGLTLSGNIFSISGAGIDTAMLASGAVTSANIASAAVQTANIADGAVTAQKLSIDLLGGVQQVVRGVINFSGSATEVTQSFSPSVDPAKSYVIVGTPVFRQQPTGAVSRTILGASLIALTANSVTVAVDDVGYGSNAIVPCRVSFQIVQSK